MQERLVLSIVGIGLALGACRPATPQSGEERSDFTSLQPRLPTGVRLAPAGRSYDVGSLPFAVVPSPEGDRMILLLSGWRQQGVQVVDRGTGAVLQTLAQPAAFLGAAFSPDGRTLYASGGNQDVVYRYSWRDKRLALMDSLVLEGTRPDLTLIFDLPVDVGLQRAHERAGSEMRFESKGVAFHERLREGFLMIAKAEPERCAVIDAAGSLDVVEARVWAAVRERLGVGG